MLFWFYDKNIVANSFCFDCANNIKVEGYNKNGRVVGTDEEVGGDRLCVRTGL